MGDVSRKHYFGWNRDALSDCPCDLKWLPADRYVLIVAAADEALSGDCAGRRLLFRTLLRAGQRHSSTQRPRTWTSAGSSSSCPATQRPVAGLQAQPRLHWEETVSS
ncbi:barstar family protein [Streptomyces sp. NPDC091387]|uniref:barstar family protein n=1 Tax=Streptomyces sp. NPDC091387 TaxID=3365998 RepID=UPI0037FD0D16